MRILLIDDSKVVRQSQVRALVKAGYEVLCASDGEEGLRLARASNPDLVILDMLLPKIAGQDVLRTLKRDPRTRQIPVVVLSGLSKCNAKKLIDEGAVDFIEKTAELIAKDDHSVVKVVQDALLRLGSSTEIGWH